MSNLSIRADVKFLRADAGEGEGLATPRIPSFSMVGYTGGIIRQAWSREPIVIDLAGMSIPFVVPIVFGHDYSLESVLGQAVATAGNQLILDGRILSKGEAAMQVVQLGDDGYQWQASVGADVDEQSLVADGDTVTVNGQTFTGPVRVVSRSTLRECSFVTLGADAATAVVITANAEGAQMDEEMKPADGAPTGPEMASENKSAEGPSDVASATPKLDIAAIRAEIEAAVTEKVKKEVKATMLEEVRNGRSGPAIHASKPAFDEKELTIAAVAMVGGLHRQVEAKYGDSPMIEAVAARAKTIGLQDILLTAARQSGYDGQHRVSAGNLLPVLRAAFATHSISSILAATYNKFLLTGFEAVENVWEQISTIRPLNDLKTVTQVRLDGGFVFDEVGNDGKIKSADAGEGSRTLTPKTYARMSSITRADIINDDLGALTAVPRRLGRGAALKFNSVFWAAFEASNSSYYQAATPAGGNALAIGAVETAYGAYRALLDPDSNPLGITPKILLVPVGLRITADKIQTGNTLLASSLGSTSSRVVEPQVNVLAGKFNIVDSAYLTSTSTWWLCADPNDLPTMEVGFLNGQRAPVVEQADASFDTLGIEVRGYFDFGVSQGESRACDRMATA